MKKIKQLFRKNVVESHSGKIAKTKKLLLFQFMLIVYSSSAQAPAPAAAVGYNLRTFGPNLVMSGSGQNWFPSNDSGGPGTFTNNTDGSVTIHPPSNASDGHQWESVIRKGGYMNFTGQTFGGGAYFVARMKWDRSNIDAAAWPAWWSNDVEGQTGFGNTNSPMQWPGQPNGYNLWFEPDFMEQMRGQTDFGSSFWQWYGTSSGPGGDQAATARTSVANNNTYHTYGCLWVPAKPGVRGYMAYDVDGVEYNRTSWDYRANRNTLPPPPATHSGPNGNTIASVGSDIDWRHIMLILGSGQNAPVTISGVEVWQASVAGNLPVTTTTDVNELDAPTMAASVYPNPFNTNFTLKISDETILKNAMVKIYDVCGREVQHVLINNNETTIERGELQNGIYFYSVINNNEKIANGKLVVED